MLGGSSLALVTVLTAFLGGLAVGAAGVARRIHRIRSPIAVFVGLEGVIAVWTVLLPSLVEASWPLMRALYGEGPGLAFAFGRFVVALILLAPPAIAMGASLPLLAAVETSDARRRGRWVASLYAVNAFGAALGVLVAGFALLPELGLTATIRIAAGLNVVAGVGAWLAAARHGGGSRPELPSPREQLAHRGLLALYFLSAASLFMHEIAWARLATLLLGSTVYAFSLLLASIVAGIALGGWLAGRLMRTEGLSRRALAVSQAAVAVAGLVLVSIVPELPFAITRWFAHGSEPGGLAVVASVIVAMFLVPAVLLGSAYPLVCRIVLGRDAPGRPAARVQAIGSVGAVAGVWAAGLILMPAAGLRNTLIFAAALSAVVAAGVIASLRPSARMRGPAFAALWLVAAVAIPAWDPARVSLGPFVQARRQPPEIATSKEALRELERGYEVVFHRDGRESSLTVKDTPDGERTLWINGKPDASSASDLATQQLLAHIPLLLHRDPRSALIVGLGSGVTVRSAVAHGLERVDTVEISAEARQVAELFTEFNRNVLRDARVRLIVADGRLHLTLSERLYDVIVFEPSNPWIAGIGDLYTRESFDYVRRRLERGGVFCLWLPAYHLDTAMFRTVVATFGDVFAASTLWHTQGSDYLLVGATESLTVAPQALVRRMSAGEVAAELAGLGIEAPDSLLANLVLDPRSIIPFADSPRRHTDDNALLEFNAPQRLIANPDEAAVLLALEGARGEDLSFIDPAPAWIDSARTSRAARGSAIRSGLYFSAGRTEEGIAALREAAAANPSDAFVERTLAANQQHADELARSGRIDEAIARYRFLLDVAPDRAATRAGYAELTGGRP